MSTPSDFSDRIAASRAAMLEAYRRRQSTDEPAVVTVATEPTVIEEPATITANDAEPIEAPQSSEDFRSVGYLQIHASAGNNSVPIPNALIVVTQTVNGEERLVALGETDQSGNSVRWSLPAPDPIEFENADTSATPAFYTVRTFADGYVTVRNLLVPIYGGVTALQEVNLIPLPEAVTESEVTYTAGAPINLR